MHRPKFRYVHMISASIYRLFDGSCGLADVDGQGRRFPSAAVLENLLKRLLERGGDLEGQLEGRRILGCLNRHDGLPRHSSLVRQLLLSHFVVLKPQAPDLVLNRWLAHAQLPRR